MLKVFVADDSTLVRERLAELISEIEGVEVVGQAGDARQALEAIQHLRPDAVILDIRMPGNNGIQVLEAIKKSAAAPVVIVLTVFPYPQYRKKCLEAGAEYFFDKATEFEQVAEVLKKIQDSTIGKSTTIPELGLK
ncbi:MAG: response regulator transcription factor [Anaerolineae bacterium]